MAIPSASAGIEVLLSPFDAEEVLSGVSTSTGGGASVFGVLGIEGDITFDSNGDLLGFRAAAVADLVPIDMGSAESTGQRLPIFERESRE